MEVIFLEQEIQNLTIKHERFCKKLIIQIDLNVDLETE